MTKKSIKKKSSVSLLLFISVTVSFFVVILLIGMTYYQAEKGMNQYKQSMHLSGSEDAAAILASTIGTIPQESPLYTQPQSLQSYLETVSSQMKKQILVVDTEEIIIADTISSSVGEECDIDAQGEVKQTISDGEIRHFTQKSTNYTVAPIKNAQGIIVGAVVVASRSSW